MKRNAILLLLGALTTVGVAAWASIKDPPTVKTELSYASNQDVVIDVILVTNHDFLGDVKPPGNDLALLPNTSFNFDLPTVSDPYMVRSQAWIRNNNLFHTGLINTFDDRKMTASIRC